VVTPPRLSDRIRAPGVSPGLAAQPVPGRIRYVEVLAPHSIATPHPAQLTLDCVLGQFPMMGVFRSGPEWVSSPNPQGATSIEGFFCKTHWVHQ